MDEKDIIHELSKILKEIEILKKRIHFLEGRYTNDELIDVVLKSTYNQNEDIVLYFNCKMVTEHLQKNLKSKIDKYNILKTNILFK